MNPLHPKYPHPVRSSVSTERRSALSPLFRATMSDPERLSFLRKSLYLEFLRQCPLFLAATSSPSCFQDNPQCLTPKVRDSWPTGQTDLQWGSAAVTQPRSLIYSCPRLFLSYESQVKQWQETQYGLQSLKYLLSGTLGSLPATLPDL